MPTPMVIYDPINRELRTVPDFFVARNSSMELLSWRKGIKGGVKIKENTELADIFWDDGKKNVLKAPTGCAGIIQSTNRRILYENLHIPPSQWLLRLKQA